jgi:O-antigen ligase
MEYNIIRQKCDTLGKWVGIILGFSIPISTALDSVLLVFIIVIGLLSGGYSNKYKIIKGNGIAILSIVVFGLYVIGMLYSTAEINDISDSLYKAAHFLLIPLLIPLFRFEKTRRYALWGFLSAMTLTLLLSYMMWLNIIPANNILKGTPEQPEVFKYYLTQNILMSLSAFLFAVQALQTRSGQIKVIFSILSILAIFNVFFMVPGRTGQLVMLFLVFYFFFSWLRWKSLAVTLAFLMILSFTFYFFPSTPLHQRFSLMIKEISEWNPNQATPEYASSIGLRLEFYKNSLQIIRKNLYIGVGTGGFKKAYASQVKNTFMVKTDNPHNEYLMITVQLGFLGLCVLFFLFYSQWRLAARLPKTFDTLAARGLLITIMSASLVTSTLFDHTERLLYFWMSAVLFAGLNIPLETEHKTQ